MALVARPIPDFYHPGGANFINGRTLNIVTRSKYGRKAIGNMTRDIQEAKNFTAPNSEPRFEFSSNSSDLIFVVDPQVKSGIHKAIDEAKQKMIMCEERRTGVKKNYSDVDTESARLKEWEVCVLSLFSVLWLS